MIFCCFARRMEKFLHRGSSPSPKIPRRTGRRRRGRSTRVGKGQAAGSFLSVSASVFRSFSRHLSLRRRWRPKPSERETKPGELRPAQSVPPPWTSSPGASLLLSVYNFSNFPSSVSPFYRLSAVLFTLGGDTGSFRLSFLCLHVWPSCQETHKHKRSRR